MALRVLLADESVTIKKVFQLALQDFGVEVTTVTVGIDVVNVAGKVKPDIVFADVLLQKKSGYDVCRELKAQPDLSRVPVVLIWSSFMELDDGKFKNSGASAHLEKPFDTQRLRQVIQELVPRARTQPMAGYLSFPKLPDFADEKTTKGIPPPPKAMPMNAAPTVEGGFEPLQEEDNGGWSMDNFAEPLPPLPNLSSPDEPEEFLAVELPTKPSEPKKRTPAAPEPILPDDPAEEDAQWVQKTLSKYKLDPARREDVPPKVSYRDPSYEKAGAKSDDQDHRRLDRSIVTNAWARPGGPKAPAAKSEEEDVFELESSLETEVAPSPAPKSAKAAPVAPALNEKQLEAIIRAQAPEVIEKVVWQVVPEIATRIIERELERLLRERNKK